MIMLNGKRIDNNIGDALPIGTLSPFVGLVAPKGYLICMGQLVDKAKYPELWELCGDTFGPSTTTQFYLPDLRGQVIAGYKEGDATFGTLGALIGGKTTSYTPAGTNSGGAVGNHTLTTNEMPSHTHAQNQWLFNGASASGGAHYGYGWQSDTGTMYNNMPSNWSYNGNTGGGAAHNHGFTNPTFTGTQANISTVQPTAVMNWIIKASMIAVIESNIEDSLTSTSSTDALSARQGKVLNDKFGNYVLTSSIVNNLTSTSTNVPLSAAQGKALNDKFGSMGTYSTTETNTGMIWIDGKPIYRKSFNGFFDDGDTILSNVDKIIAVYGQVFISGADRIIPYYEYYNNANYKGTFDMSYNNIKINLYAGGAALTNVPCRFTVEYTKTTD